jgi:hypothetical protein
MWLDVNRKTFYLTYYNSCGTEERSDEESAFEGERKKQMLRYAPSNITRKMFIHMGGPQAHVTLSMTVGRERMRTDYVYTMVKFGGVTKRTQVLGFAGWAD